MGNEGRAEKERLIVNGREVLTIAQMYVGIKERETCLHVWLRETERLRATKVLSCGMFTESS